MNAVQRPKKQARPVTAISIALLTMSLLVSAIAGIAVVKQYPGYLGFRVVSGHYSVEIYLDGRQVPQTDKQLPGQ